MKVELINHTKNALELLIFTKSTRLQAHQTLQDINEWPHEKKMAELAYMRDTIQSSWEFVDYVFKISEVSRAFTHQFVRTRTNSYAQESQRTVDVRENGHLPSNDKVIERKEFYEKSMRESELAYATLIDWGMQVQEARNVLPTGEFTSIIVKTNLRTMHDSAKVRLCTRTQGEYQNVFKEMKRLICEVHEWADNFIQVACAENGICAFPRYTECPIGPMTFNNHASEFFKKGDFHICLEATRAKIFETTHVANPKAKDGRSM